MELRRLTNEELLQRFEEMRQQKDSEISINIEFAQSIDEKYSDIENSFFVELNKRKLCQDFMDEIPY